MYKLPKAALNEHCQRNNLPAPRYTTERLPFTSDHDPQFVSTVTFQGATYTSDQAPKKKDAEHNAAQKALELIGVNEPMVDGINISQETLLIVDLENVGAVRVMDLLNRISDGWELIKVMIFATHDHYLWNKLPNIDQFTNVIKATSPPGRKDSADIHLSFEIGKLVHKLSKTCQIMIWTQDHFGHSLADCLKKEDLNALCTNSPFTSTS